MALKVGSSDNVYGVLVFSIHKNLLMNSSRRFARMLEETEVDRNHMYSIQDTNPAVFKLFNEYLYTRRIPSISPRASKTEQGTRISELCQLYVFAEIFEMHNTFLNKIMDAIQDTLVVSSTVLGASLVRNILEHGQKDSQLRNFCIANALYTVMTPGLDSAGFQWLIKNSDEFFAEFMKMLTKLPKSNDPRIRDANQEYAVEVKIKEEELEAGGVAVEGNAAAAIGPGVHPCQFHIHGRTGSDAEGADDEICYALADLNV